MHNRLESNRKRKQLKVLFAAAAAACFPSIATAQTDNWTGASNANWNTAANWSTGLVPAAGAVVDIAPSTTSTFSVGYNYNGATVTLNSLTVDYTPKIFTDTLNMASDALTAGVEFVGFNGNGAITQSGGTTSLTGTAGYISIATNVGSTGSYVMTGGSAGAMAVYVGGSNSAAGGKGVLTVGGNGLLNIAGTLTVYNTAGSALNLSGGTITAAAINVSTNPALFQWTTGSLRLTGQVIDFSNGSDSAFGGNVFGNSLTLGAAQTLSDTNWEWLYGSGSTVTQTGGVNLPTSLYMGNATGVGADATYNLSGGSLVTTNGEAIGYVNAVNGPDGNATFNQTGGTNTLVGSSALELSDSAGATGAYLLSGSGTLSSNSEYVGLVSAGVFNQSGGLNVQGTSSSISIGANGGSTGTYNLSNSGTVSTSGGEYIGAFGVGNFDQSGGLNTLLGTNSFISIAADAGSTGVYILSNSGTLLIVGNETVGNSGFGTFNQSGGLNSGTTLYVGSNSGSSGSYIFSAGSLSMTSQEVVGNFGAGSFNQTGGTNSLIGFGVLYMGYEAGSTGTYTLSGSGTLSTSNGEYIGIFGNATFNQTGGANVTLGTASFIAIGFGGTSTAVYNLGANGTLLIGGNEFIGNGSIGTFNQTGGLNSGVSLFLGALSGSTGAYILSATGSLSMTEQEVIGYGGAGSFNQTGGTDTLVGNLYLGGVASGISTGIYTFSAGSLSVTGDELVGQATFGTFNQTGGINAINGGHSLFLGYYPGSTGAYFLSATGSLATSGVEFIGYDGTGSFNQSAGVNGMTTLAVGTQPDGTGTYTLSGSGSLVVSGGEFLGSFGTGFVNQTGGVNDETTASGFIGLGANLGSTGTYVLSGTGALIAAGPEYIGTSSVGIFNQSGGTNSALNIANGLEIGSSSAAFGTYNLSGGAIFVTSYLSVGGSSFNTPQGTGVLNVSGTGVLNIGGTLMAFNTPGSGITLSGGTINTAALDFNGTPSLLNWTGGTLNLTSGVVWDSAAVNTSTSDAFLSSLTLGANQTLVVTGNETLGGTGSFSLTLNSGAAHYVSGILTISPTGTITQNAGSSLYAQQIVQAGGVVNGTLQNQATFTYQSGQFNGRLLNQGSVNLGPNFVAGNGIENDADIFLSAGQIVTVNGQGLDNLGTFDLNGATISGSGAVLNDFSGQFYGSGFINPAFTNDGVLTLQGVLRFGSTALNSGTLNGSGDIIGNFSNGPAGVVEVNSGSPLAISSAWTNAGLVLMQGGELDGAAITNTATIQGDGSINAPIANTTGVLRATAGQLTITGAGSTNGTAAQIQAAAGNTVLFTQGLAVNNGTIALTGGSFDNNNQPITNSSTGHMSGWGTFNSGYLTNNGNFNVGGNFNIFGPVTNGASGTVHATGSGLNAFFGPVINNGPIIVNAGASATFFNTFTGAGTVTNNGAIAFNAISSFPGIGGSGLMTIGATSASTSVQFTPNSGTSTQGALNINSGSTLDIANNTFKINYGSPANDSVSTIVGYLSAGFHSGAWTGTSGIVSTTAAFWFAWANASVGYADGNTDPGTIAAPNQVVIKYTLAGDANLDGSVNFGDLVTVLQNFNKGGTDWAHGNFAYGASTNFGDLVTVLQNYNKVLAPAGSSGDQLGGSALPIQIQATDVQLPEPAAFSLAVLSAAFLIKRRRNH